jgi:hypothetical protein
LRQGYGIRDLEGKWLSKADDESNREEHSNWKNRRTSNNR